MISKTLVEAAKNVEAGKAARMNKSEQAEALMETALAAIVKAGGVQVGTGIGRGVYGLSTPYGELRICPSVDMLQHGEKVAVTLFCKWVEIKRAKDAGFDVNAFNGKWNHHGLTSALEINYVLARATGKD